MISINTISDVAVHLHRWLSARERVAVALSGGVDSMTLAAYAHAALSDQAFMFHAVSPAVPEEATQRVRQWATRQGWRLEVINAGEFDRTEYVANPVNRCFYCKTSLYGTIAHHTQLQILSGTNTDDLAEYRPGLQAADQHAVRHPFVELGLNKASVRKLAREFGMGDVAELPSAPCLSSRMETGVAIDAPTLDLIHRAERLIQQQISAKTVRCRVRRSGVFVELDESSLEQLGEGPRAGLAAQVARLFREGGKPMVVSLAPYRNGSAFLTVNNE